MRHLEKINDAGVMHIITSGGITCYDIFTKAGKYRGGKIYNSDKKYIILSGQCEITTLEGGTDTVRKVGAEDDIFEIASNIPHLFYFPEDTRLIEWFSGDTKSEHFERYRAMKK